MNYRRVRSAHKILLRVLDKIFEFVGILLFASVIIVNAIEIFSRTFLNFSLYWVQEFTVIFCGYLIFCGIFVIFNRRANIFILFLVNMFSDFIKSIIRIFNDIIMLGFTVLGVYSTFNYLTIVYGGFTQTLKIPIYVVYLPILISFLGIFIVLIDWLIEDIEYFATIRS